MNITEPNNSGLSLQAAIFTTCLCMTFGANTVAIKIALTGIGAFTLAGIRFGLAAIIIWIWALSTGKSLLITKKQLFRIVIISALFLLQLSLYHMGISLTNASRASLLVNIQPFFMLILAHFFIPGDRIKARKVAGMLLGFAGVAVVFLEKTGVTSDFRFGDILVLASSFLWACNMAYTKRVIHTFQPFQVVLYSMIISVPFFFLGGYLFDRSMIESINTEILAALTFSTVIIASFGFVAWQTLLQRYSAVSLHSFVFILPISGVLSSGLILGEPVTFKILLSLIFLVMGIIAVHSG